MLNYPLTYNSLHLPGPTLFYIDEEGTPVQLQLTNEQVQAIVDDWNTGEILDSEIGESTTELKPPLAFNPYEDKLCAVAGT